jgi:hypothetical protein
MSSNYSREEAQAIIRRIYRTGGEVVLTHHVEKERGPQRDFKTPDIRNVLLHGEVVTEPVQDRNFNNWKCQITGLDGDGHELNLIVGFSEIDEQLVIITGF